MAARPFVFLALLLHPPLTSAEEFKLGYLYIQSESSWVVESFSQFKLAVAHVNAASALGGGHNLSYAVFNSQGQSTQALAGAIELLSDPHVIGLVGTGYSSAAESPARYCSLRQKPMISPGSTSMDLVNKEQYPFFLRSIASDGQQMKRMASVVSDFGWRYVAIGYSQSFLRWGEVLQQEVLDRGVHVLAYSRLPDVTQATYYRLQMELPLTMVRARCGPSIECRTSQVHVGW